MDFLAFVPIINADAGKWLVVNYFSQWVKLVVVAFFWKLSCDRAIIK
jgi:hypothetical protein